VAIELINANDPKSFYGAIFIRDEKTCRQMLEYYQKLWDSAASTTTDNNTNNNAKLITETSVSRRYYTTKQSEYQ
jgi:hypothetical protein